MYEQILAYLQSIFKCSISQFNTMDWLTVNFGHFGIYIFKNCPSSTVFHTFIILSIFSDPICSVNIVINDQELSVAFRINLKPRYIKKAKFYLRTALFTQHGKLMKRNLHFTS